MGGFDELHFNPAPRAKPSRSILTAETTLQHFATVTFLVDPAELRRHIHTRFEPDCIEVGGHTHALVSVVTFLDRDFRFAACPWFKRSFGQTNYRSYVTDTVQGDHVAWFFGTCLDSVTSVIPRHVWRLPWHRARMAFSCNYDEESGRYARLQVETRSRWAPASLDIDDTGEPPRALAGFSRLEAGQVLLTHPMRGVYFRRDGSLGTYTIWHDRMHPTAGRVRTARFPLLERLGLVPTGELRSLHSTLVQPSVDFTIYLPPRRVAADRDVGPRP